MSEDFRNRRKSIRFSPDQSTLVKIDLRPDADTKNFRATKFGLLYEEASKGCGVVTLNTELLQVKELCLIQVGELPVIKAEVRWRMQLDSTTIKLGFLYLD